MSKSDERAQRAEDAAEQLRKMTITAKQMKSQGYSNSEIAEAMGISENYVRNLVHTEINWGYNCLTVGIHHGRPEAIWNLPLLQTVNMFTPVQFQNLVTDRIYNDAMQFVEHADTDHNITTPEWADKVTEIAAPRILPIYQKKIGEITKYYRSPEFRRDLDDAIERNKVGKLNPGYKPLHGHDSINMLCRIIGVNASIEASKETDGSR